jgi:hypothetical protein
LRRPGNGTTVETDQDENPDAAQFDHSPGSPLARRDGGLSEMPLLVVRGRPLMRWILAAWGLPLAAFWGWYFLSAFNLHFGYVMLTRKVHDLVFQIYGETLGIDPAALPGLVAKACIIDTLFLFSLLAFRRRAQIVDWVKSLRDRESGEVSPSA